MRREETITGLCRFDGCLNPPERAGWCAGHRKRLQRGRPLAPLNPSRREQLALAIEALEDAMHELEAAKDLAFTEIERRGSAYANADSENDREFKRRQREFYDAVEAYARVRFRRRRHRRQPPVPGQVQNPRR